MVLLLLLLPMLGGCTVLGYGLGSIIDDNKAALREEPLATGLGEIHVGERVTCVTEDGAAFTGDFIGLGVPTKTTLKQLLPAEPPGDCAQRKSVRLGDVLVMKRKDMTEPTAVVYASTDRERMFYKPQDGDAVQALLFTQIEQLTRCDGQGIPPPYTKRVDEGLFERVAQFRLQTGGQTVDIDTSTIRCLRYERSPVTARFVLAIAGLACDAAIIVFYLASEAMVDATIGLLRQK